MKPQLFFFDYGLHQEMIRMAFIAARKNLKKENFEDIRFNSWTWPESKAMSPSGKCPFLKLADGTCLTETLAIFYWVGMTYNLTCNDVMGSTRMWEIIMALESVWEKLIPAVREYHECDGWNLMKTVNEIVFPDAMSRVEMILDVSQDKEGHCCGNMLTLADIAVYNLIENGGHYLMNCDLTKWRRVAACFDMAKKTPAMLHWKKMMGDQFGPPAPPY